MKMLILLLLYEKGEKAAVVNLDIVKCQPWNQFTKISKH